MHDKLMLWSKFFLTKTLQEKEDIIKMEPEFQQATTALFELSSNNEVQQLAEMRKLAYFNKRLTETAIREEGLTEGLIKGKIEVARQLLDILDDQTISEKTGIALSEIKKMRV